MNDNVYAYAPEPDEHNHGLIVLETDRRQVAEMTTEMARDLIEALREAIHYAEQEEA